ncbi:hypothetical protein Pcinc_006896 [Petrolisthes cinctipes]|uniref:Uncharacterized protein n=1 Tax=Petrolisthes cinctipes TaxID=88211 RepID=A0AAE1GAC4_PETCI|nr:hypothetical protein Pcinc_006896 [Petrolisthes cinctipes]
MAAFLCGQPETLDKVSKTQRWFVFAVGMIETMLWSGLIFGWPSLVHVLKLQGVYGNLCLQYYPFDDGGNKNNINHTTTFSNDHGDLLPPATTANEDEKFALIYTVACVLYSIPGILVGYALHHLGLAFTRVVGGLMVSGGFVLLSFTSAGSGHLSVSWREHSENGGTAVRQPLPIKPQHRHGHNQRYLHTFCRGVHDYAASLIVILTPLIPSHHIPFTIHQEEVKKEEVEEEEEKSRGGVKSKQQHEPSIRNSIFSISSLLHAYWLFMNFFGVSLFATHFNSWINLFAKSTEETSQYSTLYGYANILCFFFTPIPGITIDLLGRRFKRDKTGLRAEVASLQAMMLPMVVVSCTV